MYRKQSQQLVNVLVLIPSLIDNEVRKDIVNGLPRPIRESWKTRAALRPDVINLLEICSGHEYGIDALFEQLRYYEGDTSIPYQEAERLNQRISYGKTLIDMLKSAKTIDTAIIQEAYGKSLPDGSVADAIVNQIEDLITALDTFPADAERIYPLQRFVEIMAAAVDCADTQSTLHIWNDDACQTIYADSNADALTSLRNQLSSAAQIGDSGAGRTAYALVELLPDPNAENQTQPRFTCEVVFWDPNGKVRHWCCEDQADSSRAWTLAELPQKLAEIFRANAAPREMIIEFLLPDDLIAHDVDQWDDKTRRRGDFTLGLSYPVVVRPLARMQDNYYLNLCRATWQQMNQKLHAAPKHHTRWICRSDTWDHKNVVLELENAQDIFCMCLTFMPTQVDEILDVLLDAGLPVALWPRLNFHEINSDDEIRDELMAMIHVDALYKVPWATKKFRLDADAKEQHKTGHCTTLIWDDPTRILPKYAPETDQLYEPEM